MTILAQHVKAPSKRRTLVGAALIAAIGSAGICTMSPGLAGMGTVMVAGAVRGAARLPPLVPNHPCAGGHLSRNRFALRPDRFLYRTEAPLNLQKQSYAVVGIFLDAPWP